MLTKVLSNHTGSYKSCDIRENLTLNGVNFVHRDLIYSMILKIKSFKFDY